MSVFPPRGHYKPPSINGAVEVIQGENARPSFLPRVLFRHPPSSSPILVAAIAYIVTGYVTVAAPSFLLDFLFTLTFLLTVLPYRSLGRTGFSHPCDFSNTFSASPPLVFALACVSFELRSWGLHSWCHFRPCDKRGPPSLSFWRPARQFLSSAVSPFSLAQGCLWLFSPDPQRSFFPLLSLLSFDTKAHIRPVFRRGGPPSFETAT